MNGPSSTIGSNTWEGLLLSARVLLEGLPSELGAPARWTMGGGTVLMLRYGHRASRDVDLFLRDPQLLACLSPRVNEAAATLCQDYVEASHFLKLSIGSGEIDFIVAPDLTGLAPEVMRLAGADTRTDPSLEIIAKKCFYRAAALKVRDVLDWAVVLEHDPRAGEVLGPILATKKRALNERVEALAADFVSRARLELALFEPGERALDTAVARVARHLERML